MINVAIVGCGAISSAVLAMLANRRDIRVSAVIVRPRSKEAADLVLAQLSMDAQVCSSLAQARVRPDLLVECAGHQAIVEHVLPALQSGVACVVASVGALSHPGLAEQLSDAAQLGGTQVELLSGAIGAIDALAAARHGGLERVEYTGRKPPLAWTGTPASERFELASLTRETVIFQGTAREAAALYPKNANVAATVAMAGLGFEKTQVLLLADPAVSDNVHQVLAVGAFGQFELCMRGKPLAGNPKTSSLTAYSVVRAICNRVDPLVI